MIHVNKTIFFHNIALHCIALHWHILTFLNLLTCSKKQTLFRCLPKGSHPPKKSAYCWTLSKRRERGEPYLGICFIHLQHYCSDIAALIWSSALSNKKCPKIQEIPKSAHKKMSLHVTHDLRQPTDDR